MMNKLHDGKTQARLGTKKRPAVVHVQTEARMAEISAIFSKNGWQCVIGLEPDKPEDLTDLEILQNRPATVSVEKTPGRNDPCPCGSGKKYKKCCGAA